jgi:hypothetical protein
MARLMVAAGAHVSRCLGKLGMTVFAEKNTHVFFFPETPPKKNQLLFSSQTLRRDALGVKRNA